MLGDWLVVSQVLLVNPASAVRGPNTTGATPVLSPAAALKLLETIDTGALAELRDRALLSVMLCGFAWVSAVLGMRRQDYFGQGSRGWLRLHEKGGRRHDVPAPPPGSCCPRRLRREAGGLEEPKGAALFQTVEPAGRRLTGRALDRRLVAPGGSGSLPASSLRPPGARAAPPASWPSSSPRPRPPPASRPRPPAGPKPPPAASTSSRPHNRPC